MTSSGVSSPRAVVHTRTVRFGDCDPAGIVYFPRYFEFFHDAMEVWFDQCFAATTGSYAAFLGRGRGLPAVHSEADFARPSRMGDTIEVAMAVESVGTSSMVLTYAVRGAADAAGATPRVTGKTVVVQLDLDPTSPTHGSAVAFDAAFRAALGV